jgi:cysteine desulfurase
MLPYFSENFGNPSSNLHTPGLRAAEAVDHARSQVAALICARPSEIVFTNGATESNNLAIFGVAAANQKGRRRIITTPIEHKAVLEPLKYLEQQGYELIWLPIDSKGRVDLDAAKRLINDDTLLISVQAANNEIGTIQPVAEIAAIAHRSGALVHCDAAQAVGKVPLDVSDWGVHLLSISAHKLYGPKGVGALYVNQRIRKVSISPIILGGGQELGLRSGTHNVPGIVGLGEACAIAQLEMPQERQRVAELRDALERLIQLKIQDIKVNGDVQNRLPGNSSLSFPGVEADAMILNLPDLALSMGSACNSGAMEPSYVLTAIGLSRQLASSTIRIGWGRFNSISEVETASILIGKAYSDLLTLA